MKTLKNYLKNNNYLVVFSASFFLLLFVGNVKGLVVIFAIIFSLFYFFTESDILESTLLTLLVSLPFERHLRQWALYSPFITDTSGYYFYFGISIKLFFGLVILMLLLTPKGRQFFKGAVLNKTSLTLLFFFTLATINSLLTSQRLIFPFTGYVRLGFAIFLFYLGQSFWLPKNYHKISAYFTALSFIIIFFSFRQIILQHPIGHFLELTPSFSPQGYYTTDGIPQYRVAGFFSHPVYFGSFICLIIPVFLGLQRYKPLLSLPVIGLLTVSSLSTQSRSVWISLLFLLISYFVFFLKSNKKILLTILFVFLTIFTILSLTRLSSITTLFEGGNSGIARLNHLYLTFDIFKSSPLTGVGLNNFSYETYQQHFTNYFAAPPHNTILIFLTELGLPTTLLFLAFLTYLLWPTTNIFRWPILKFSLWLSLITFIISSQFHPLFNLDPTFEFFMLIAGIYSKICATPQST